MEVKPKVIVICGPTASGKTSLSIAVAKAIGGEIISADSMQIYRYMDIGTAKVTKEEAQGIPHYLIDVIEPNERYSVADYKIAAEQAIQAILDKGKVPIIVGGTGLYVDALIYGIEYPEIEFDADYRQQLEKQVEEQGLAVLYAQAKEIDPEACEKISENDQKRILRVLEIFHATGKNKTWHEIQSRKKGVPYDYQVYALDMDRTLLYERINRRVDIMLEKGLVQEVQNLLTRYTEFPTAMQGLGYKEVVEYLKGNYSQQEMKETIQQESRRYAKRQLTWFRKNKQTIWLTTSGTAEDEQNNLSIILEGMK